MKEFLELGQAPPGEDCAQLGSPNYASNALRECRAYIQALRTYLGREPDGAELGIKWFEHDYGRYAEVVCFYDPLIERAVDYAFQCEAKGPVTWEDAGMTAPARENGRGR